MVERFRACGRVNSLAQTLIKYTAPGVPDTYQGGELWDFRLVDPDNRTPVDYELRRSMLEELKRGCRRKRSCGAPRAACPSFGSSIAGVDAAARASGVVWRGG